MDMESQGLRGPYQPSSQADHEKQFVGREAELAAIGEWALASSTHAQVMNVVGLAGIGKSSLARAVGRRLQGTMNVYFVSADRASLHPRSLTDQLRAWGVASLAELGTSDQADFVVLDAFERISSHAEALFFGELAGVRPNLRVLLTSRVSIPDPVRLSPEWKDRHQEIRLHAFSAQETRSFLTLGNREHLTKRAYELTKGYPLALALLGEQLKSSDGNLDTDEEVVRSLARQLLVDAPTESHRMALYASSLPLSLDRDLLDAMLAPSQSVSDRGDLYEWLRSHHFVEEDRWGLRIHELVRDFLHRDFCKHHPSQVGAVAGRAVAEFLSRMGDETLVGQRRLMIEALCTRRDSRFVADNFQLEGARNTIVERGTDDDALVFADVIEKEEGSDARRIFLEQHQAGQDGFFVSRDSGSLPAGYVLEVSPEQAPEVLERDPIYVEAQRRFFKLTGTPAPDRYQRWFGTRAHHQDLCPEMHCLMVSGPLISLNLDPIPLTIVLVTLGRDRWRPFAEMMSVVELPGGAFEWQGREYGLWTLDLRPFLPEGKEKSGRRRELALGIQRHMLVSAVGGEPIPPSKEAVEVEPGKSAAIASADLREVLRDLSHPKVLSKSPLLKRARDAGFSGEPRAAMRAWVCFGIERMEDTEKGEALADVLRVTYIKAPEKQYAAAVALGIPWGTYRHRLRRAIARLADELGS